MSYLRLCYSFRSMKIHVIYRPKSDHARRIEDYLREFTRRRMVKIEEVDIDTREGVAEASLYDIIDYPAILVIKDDGELLVSWQGQELPLIDELAAYATD